MNLYKHISFDFDGVVADSAAVCAEEINRLRQHFPKIPEVHTQDDFAYIYPGPLRTSLRRFGLSNARIGEFFDNHSKRMMERAQELKPFAHVIEILIALDPDQYTIVTSSYSVIVRDLLSKYVPTGLVKSISILGRELRMKKSEKFCRIMSEKGIKNRELLNVGDMVSDILYASDAGIDCAAVGWGYHPMHYLRAFDANYFISSTRELQQLLTNNLKTGDAYVN